MDLNFYMGWFVRSYLIIICRLCLVIENFEGNCNGKKIERKNTRKKK